MQGLHESCSSRTAYVTYMMPSHASAPRVEHVADHEDVHQAPGAVPAGGAWVVMRARATHGNTLSITAPRCVCPAKHTDAGSLHTHGMHDHRTAAPPFHPTGPTIRHRHSLSTPVLQWKPRTRATIRTVSSPSLLHGNHGFR